MAEYLGSSSTALLPHIVGCFSPPTPQNQGIKKAMLVDSIHFLGVHSNRPYKFPIP